MTQHQQQIRSQASNAVATNTIEFHLREQPRDFQRRSYNLNVPSSTSNNRSSIDSNSTNDLSSCSTTSSETSTEANASLSAITKRKRGESRGLVPKQLILTAYKITRNPQTGATLTKELLPDSYLEKKGFWSPTAVVEIHKICDNKNIGKWIANPQFLNGSTEKVLDLLGGTTTVALNEQNSAIFNDLYLKPRYAPLKDTQASSSKKSRLRSWYCLRFLVKTALKIPFQSSQQSNNGATNGDNNMKPTLFTSFSAPFQITVKSESKRLSVNHVTPVRFCWNSRSIGSSSNRIGLTNLNGSGSETGITKRIHLSGDGFGHRKEAIKIKFKEVNTGRERYGQVVRANQNHIECDITFPMECNFNSTQPTQPCLIRENVILEKDHYTMFKPKVATIEWQV